MRASSSCAAARWRTSFAASAICAASSACSRASSSLRRWRNVVGRADVALRVGRLQLDVVLVGVDGLVEAARRGSRTWRAGSRRRPSPDPPRGSAAAGRSPAASCARRRGRRRARYCSRISRLSFGIGQLVARRRRGRRPARRRSRAPAGARARRPRRPRAPAIRPPAVRRSSAPRERLPRLDAVGGDVVALVRIVPEVVELLARRLDVAVAVVGERGQLAPAEVVARVQRLGVDRPRGQVAGAVEQRLQRAAAQVPGNRRLHQVEDRRHDVDVLHRRRRRGAPRRRRRPA